MNENRKRKDGNVPGRQMPNASVGNSAISRGQFLKTIGVGAAAVGVAAMGMSGVAKAVDIPPENQCSDHYFGFDIAVPYNSIVPLNHVVIFKPCDPQNPNNGCNPAFPGGVTFDVIANVNHPLYDDVTRQYGNQIQCGTNLISLCIPQYSHDIMYPTFPGVNWVNGVPETDFKGTNMDTFFNTMDFGVQFTGAYIGYCKPDTWPQAPPYCPTNLVPPFDSYGPYGPPVPGQTPTPNWGQVWAMGVTSAAVYTGQYRRPNTNPFITETQIPLPSTIGPEFDPLDAVYTPVSFDAHYPMLFDPNPVLLDKDGNPILDQNGNPIPNPKYNPTGKFKMFGYFFEGKGVWKNDRLARPLVYMLNGITAYIDQISDVTAGFRKLVASFVNRGFNVLFVDKAGHGWSQGTTIMWSPKIYLDVLKQLGDKKNMKGAPLLSMPVKSTPIVLVGHSLGALLLQQVMAVNQNHGLIGFVNATPSGTPFGEPFDISEADLGYNFKGFIDLEGSPAGWKFTSSGTQRMWSAGRTIAKTKGLNFNLAPALSEYIATVPKTESQPGWPALMVVTCTQDWMAPYGALYAYNMANGLKKILIYEGSHGRSVIQPNVELLKTEVIEFAADAVMNTNIVDTTKLTMKQLICSSPQIRTDVTPAPPTAGHLASYYAQMKDNASKTPIVQQ